MHVRSSKTLFTVERFGVLETFKKLAADPAHRIALLGDTGKLLATYALLFAIGMTL